jgi:hypothetical protein
MVVWGNAMREGHANVLEWLLAHHPETKLASDNPYWVDAVDHAVADGNLAALKVMKNADGLVLDEEHMDKAAYYGHFETLKWLHEQGVFVNPDVASTAIARGDLRILVWLVDQDCPVLPNWMVASMCATEERQLAILKWCRETPERRIRFGLRFDDVNECFDHAVDHDRLDVAIWLRGVELRTVRPTWIRVHPYRAAEYGSLKTLIWLLKSGCPYDLSALKRVASQHAERGMHAGVRECISRLERGAPIIPEDVFCNF